MNWMFGLDGTLFGKAGQPLSYGELSALSFAEKKHVISVICSARQGTEQHNRRLAFVKILKEELGDTLHWFGHGVNPVRDKSEAIIPYRYHLVLENNTIPHFWTEKLADALLGDRFPIVAGGSQVEDYFSTDSFEYINLNDIDAAVARVADLVKRDIWAARYPAIRASRERLLTEHNLFAFCEKYINYNDRPFTASSIRPSTIRPIYSADYRKFREVRKRVRHRLRKAFPYGIF
jgi:Glycosyltransferase family 10 (fucosyltransferase) C-term